MLCRRCWLMNKDCICQKAKHIPSSQFQHRLIIYMCVFHCLSLICTLHGLPPLRHTLAHTGRHFKEYSRSSNTGALPQVSLDDSRISVFVKGIPSHDSEVMRMCVGLGFGLDCSCCTFALLF